MVLKVEKNQKYVVIAIDHGCTLGALDGLDTPANLYSEIELIADAVLVSYGSFMRFGKSLKNTPAILRCDGGWSPLQTGGKGLGQYHLIYDAEDAVRLGASGVVCMAVFGDKESESSLLNLCRLVRSAKDTGLPVIGEVLFSRPPTFKERIDAVRIAAELGSDIIKTEHPGNNENFSTLCQKATAPVLVLGGPKLDQPIDMLKLVEDSMSAGGAGVAFGRNIWQQHNPSAWARSVYEIVHNNTSAEKAYELIE